MLRLPTSEDDLRRDLLKRCDAWDPDQPRDEGGKFSSTGGGGGGKAREHMERAREAGEKHEIAVRYKGGGGDPVKALGAVREVAKAAREAAHAAKGTPDEAHAEKAATIAEKIAARAEKVHGGDVNAQDVLPPKSLSLKMLVRRPPEMQDHGLGEATSPTPTSSPSSPMSESKAKGARIQEAVDKHGFGSKEHNEAVEREYGKQAITIPPPEKTHEEKQRLLRDIIDKHGFGSPEHQAAAEREYPGSSRVTSEPKGAPEPKAGKGAEHASKTGEHAEAASRAASKLRSMGHGELADKAEAAAAKAKELHARAQEIAESDEARTPKGRAALRKLKAQAEVHRAEAEEHVAAARGHGRDMARAEGEHEMRRSRARETVTGAKNRYKAGVGSIMPEDDE